MAWIFCLFPLSACSDQARINFNGLANGWICRTRSVGASEAKTHLAALLDAVSAGEQITITLHGRPVARLVPPAGDIRASVAETIAQLRQFSHGKTLGGLSIAELRDLGRR